MANQKPYKLLNGVFRPFETGDSVPVANGGTGLTTTGANTVLVSDSLDTVSARALAASDIASGTLATARLGSGTADSTTFLRGDQTWATVDPGAGSGTDKLFRAMHFA